MFFPESGVVFSHGHPLAEGEPAKSQESKGAKLPSGAARGAVDALELSESGEYSSDVPSSLLRFLR